MDDKTRLLRSLAIDRPQPATPSVTRRDRRAGLLTLGAVGIVAVLGAAAGMWLWFAPPSAKVPTVETAAAHPPQPEPVQRATAVSEQRNGSSLVASGFVVARRKATIAAEITGKVVELLVDEGMVVQAGQVLAKLDDILADKDYVLAEARAEASDAAVAAIAADLRDAERILERTQTLSQKNFATEADLTKSQARVGVLRAQLRQAEAQRSAARVEAQRFGAVLSKYQIRAPFPGIVVDRSAQPGEMISPLSAGGGFTRTGICTIVDMDSIEVEVDVNEASIGRLHAGTRVGAALDAYPDWTVPGAVIAIVPTANREKATVKVRVGLDVKDPRILPDMAIKVTFLGDSPGRPDAPSAGESKNNVVSK
ncbi:efflux RND transporter periplasmic adaptor subunit [Bradyrhizobium canariense]|uniref:efflux RND transporter periplasmic adaptor subunit n=1 Tax=Bradyrhizobium canariense TaxID=255045 RepID=UPI001B8A4DAB|nr:efflux RND transporter periplasmic adaptor subunit [Bradyrhizobium canariense]MBR0955334.1 efflux RND transporter periplasmic adaptor subunit [Bradyrhizobium canariense]